MAIIVWGIQNAATILNPILLAVVITITVLPLPRMLQRRGIPSWLSLVLTILMVVAIFVLVGVMIFLALSQISAQLPAISIPGLSELTGGAAADDSVQATLDTLTLEELVNEIARSTNIRQFSDIFAAIVLGTARAAGALFTTLLIFFFMLVAAVSVPSSVREGVNLNIPGFETFLDLTSDVRSYMAITTFINLLVGIGNTILLWALGVPYALLWGLFSWFMGYIPAVGFWIALLPPTILAYAESGLQTAIIVFVGYVLINGTVENFVKPRVLGDNLRISPVVVFIALFVWAWLLGGVGAILAVPLTMLIITVLESIDATRWVAEVMRYTGRKRPDAATVGQLQGILSQVQDGLVALGVVNPRERETSSAADATTGEHGDSPDNAS